MTRLPKSLFVATAVASSLACTDNRSASPDDTATSNDDQAENSSASDEPGDEPSDTANEDPGSTPAPSESSTGDDGDSEGPSPSSGCGAANPPSGTLTMDIDGAAAEFIVSLPPNYDPDTPYPLGFGFHGWGRTGQNCHDGDCAGFQTAMNEHAVLVYMSAIGGEGWESENEREPNVAFFQRVLAQVSETTCIDTKRVFAAGTSSGAHFVNVLGCRFGDLLAAISPVAGVLPETQGCVGQIAALVIHGISDPHVLFEYGEVARDFWRERNGCSGETTPAISSVHSEVEATDEHHACAVYQGCDDSGQVTWCEHSEGGYDGSTHGWPLFGGDAIWEFVSTLK